MASQAMHVAQPVSGETLKFGEKNCALAGNPEQITSDSTPCYEVLLQAKNGTTGRIYVGGAGVPNNDTGGIFLAAGDSISISAQNLNQIYINSTVNGEGVGYIYW